MRIDPDRCSRSELSTLVLRMDAEFTDKEPTLLPPQRMYDPFMLHTDLWIEARNGDKTALETLAATTCGICTNLVPARIRRNNTRCFVCKFPSMESVDAGHRFLCVETCTEINRLHRARCPRPA